MAKYGSEAGQKVKKAMHERKAGTLKSGKSGKRVKSRKQAIAIGLSQARRAGAKVPAAPKKSGGKKAGGGKKKSGTRSSTKKTSPTKSTKRSSSTRKSSSKKAATRRTTGGATGKLPGSELRRTRTAGAKSSRTSVKTGASVPAS